MSPLPLAARDPALGLDAGAARHEVKFVAPESRAGELERWIRLHPAGFRSVHPERSVQSVYFDTPDLADYALGASGASERVKLRLRWYGDEPRAASSALELKLRRNRLGWKRLHAVGPVDLTAGRWAELRRGLRERLPAVARAWLDARPQPVLLGRYRRRYLASRDGRVRLTLDRRQAVLDQRLSARPRLAGTIPLPALLVLEFKFAAGERAAGEAAMAGIPIRASRHSKYALGVAALLGG